MFAIALGLFIDFANIIIGVRLATNHSRESGVPIIPAICYLVGLVSFLCEGYNVLSVVLTFFILIAFHVFSILLFPWLIVIIKNCRTEKNN